MIPICWKAFPFSREPSLYLRGAGTEIPYYQPFASDKNWPEGSGTWELLLQSAHGRYLQIRLELQGNSHVTPQLLALRAYYPTLLLRQTIFARRLLRGRGARIVCGASASQHGRFLQRD